MLVRKWYEYLVTSDCAWGTESLIPEGLLKFHHTGAMKYFPLIFQMVLIPDWSVLHPSQNDFICANHNGIRCKHIHNHYINSMTCSSSGLCHKDHDAFKRSPLVWDWIRSSFLLKTKAHAKRLMAFSAIQWLWWEERPGIVVPVTAGGWAPANYVNPRNAAGAGFAFDDRLEIYTRHPGSHFVLDISKHDWSPATFLGGTWQNTSHYCTRKVKLKQNYGFQYFQMGALQQFELNSINGVSKAFYTHSGDKLWFTWRKLVSEFFSNLRNNNNMHPCQSRPRARDPRAGSAPLGSIPHAWPAGALSIIIFIAKERKYCPRIIHTWSIFTLLHEVQYFNKNSWKEVEHILKWKFLILTRLVLQIQRLTWRQ